MMIRTAIGILAIVAGACVPVCADTDKLGRDDFVSTTITDVFDKVGKYTSGEKGLLDPDEKPAHKDSGYTTDPLGRSLPDPAIKPLKRPVPAEERQ